MKEPPVRVDGSKVAALREELGWNQQKLGTEAGLHVMTVSKIERSPEGPAARTAIETVWLLARAFTEHLGREITVDELLATPKPKEAAASA